ncbi:MAG: flagellar export chaperone FlgN [Oscillospiraceae bacterium]|nr:flagellar export chaperone FlgN [Oscillospiraceae bacterium]
MIKLSKENETDLLKLLEEELSAWKQIYELTERQAQFLDANESDALDKSIDKRQAIIEKIKRLHQESDILMQSCISGVYANEGGRIEAIDAITAKIRKQIEDCTKINDSNIVAASDKKDDYLRCAQEIAQKRKGIGVYALDVPNHSELFDKRL